MLADKSRLQIVLALARDSELHVSALCDLLGQSQPAVSHHLTLMRYGRAGRLQPGRQTQLLPPWRPATSAPSWSSSSARSATNAGQLQFSDFALTFKPR